MFHKAFKTNTGNGLGSFLESFYIMEEKKKKEKRRTLLLCAVQRESVFPIPDTKFHYTVEATH